MGCEGRPISISKTESKVKEECNLIVYENLNGKTVQEILEAHAEELRTDPWTLAYEPSSDTNVYLSNVFDIPCITIHGTNDEYVGYASAEHIDTKFADMLNEYFWQGFTVHPYKEWLAIQQQAKDDDKTLLEVGQLVRRCQKRKLSDQCRQQIRDAVLAI